MPTLNSAGHIQRSLGSLVEQACHPFELLIIDGGSSDATLPEASRILVGSAISHRIIQDLGSSIYGAINRGIREARGDWIYVMGSDDMLLGPDVFASFQPILKSASPNVFVVHGDVWIEDPGYRYGQPWDLPRFLERNISHQSAFYRRQAIERLGMEYDESYSLYADWDYNIKLFSRGAFSYVPLPVAAYACAGKSSLRVDERFLAEKDGNARRYFGWRAVWLMPPHRFALACGETPGPGLRAQSLLNRILWALRKPWL